MNDGTTLAGELSALAQEPAPPSGVDVHEAVRRGRGRLLRRRVAWLTAATAVVASSVALAALLPVRSEAAGPAGRATATATASASPSPSGVSTWNPVPPPTGAPAPSSTKTLAPLTGRDPLVADGRFGWLPDRVNRTSYALQAEGGYANAAVDPIGPTTPSFHLTVFPVGVTPALPVLMDGKPNLPGYTPGNHAIRIEAPPVNGREAYWISASDPNVAKGMNELRWQTAEGRWAQLDSGELSGDDAQRVPLQVAAGVTTGHWEVPLPLRFDGLPAGFTAYSVSLDQTRGGTDFQLRLGLRDSADHAIGVSVQPDVPSPEQSGPPGGPVRQSPGTCKSESGVRVCVRPSSSQDAEHAFDQVGGAQGLLDRITLFGTDPAKWSTGTLG
ncbi:hypothetical protein ACFW1A_29115 [Kitasatospora sp. NPDC058965]|uniref:hypothetical protein n=1 Tax=Kitasatospora sp. NPDC058965 TaxID=3346682 RepID=UPI0036A88BEF